MSTDIKLDQQGGNWLVAESSIFKSTATDIMLDAPSRRKGGSSPYRRALVHDFEDGLTLNYAGDYPGGVTVHGGLQVTGDLRLNGRLVADHSGLASTSALDNAVRRIQTLEQTLESLLALVGAVVIPNWPNRTEILEGDDMRLVNEPAEELGLTIEYHYEYRNPKYEHEEVISISPAPGTVVMRGITVVVRMNLEE
ncbi:PASTA domain-containing protein [Compostimonas suwonensis]|uniref:PASTA domain-containing protein n=1 Tax=Compostimonas suwonensis TaxID=1048394 RepID=A0A2M9BWK7_9MICO|nr:PASTA domain-containing protein [Compostimonas suwonensis]PJJ62305.1 hypothetical protein CLV54_2104 [Compostimonas suwonensis]